MIKRMMITSLLFMNVASASQYEHVFLDDLSDAVRAVHPNAPKISYWESYNLNQAAQKEGKSVKDFCKQQEASLLQCMPGFVAHTCQKGTALLEKKDTAGNYNYSPLHWAAIKDDRIGVQTLLAVGVHIDTQDKYGNTALMYAVLNSNRRILNLLMELNANPSLKNKKGESAADMLKDVIKWHQEALYKLTVAIQEQAGQKVADKKE